MRLGEGSAKVRVKEEEYGNRKLSETVEPVGSRWLPTELISWSRVVTNDESPLDTMGCHQQCKTIFLQVHCPTRDEFYPQET